MQNNTEAIILHIDAELEELIPFFLGKRQKDISEIRLAIAAGDYKRLSQIGHNLKGIGAGYGFQRVTDIGVTLEEAGKREDRDAATQCLDDIENYLTRIEIIFV